MVAYYCHTSAAELCQSYDHKYCNTLSILWQISMAILPYQSYAKVVTNTIAILLQYFGSPLPKLMEKYCQSIVKILEKYWQSCGHQYPISMTILLS